VKIEGRAKMLTIYIGEADHFHHRPLYQVLVERLSEEGVAGATVLRGIEGYGKASRIHTASILRMSEDLPVVITVVDKEERINGIMPIIDEMVKEGLVILENVDVITYRSEKKTKGGK
jgi:PII-like signaling protein